MSEYPTFKHSSRTILPFHHILPIHAQNTKQISIYQTYYCCLACICLFKQELIMHGKSFALQRPSVLMEEFMRQQCVVRRVLRSSLRVVWSVRKEFFTYWEFSERGNQSYFNQLHAFRKEIFTRTTSNNHMPLGRNSCFNQYCIHFSFHHSTDALYARIKKVQYMKLV